MASKIRLLPVTDLSHLSEADYILGTVAPKYQYQLGIANFIHVITNFVNKITGFDNKARCQPRPCFFVSF